MKIKIFKPVLTQESYQKKLNLPLNEKIDLSLAVIQEWYEYWNGNVYVSFSGGKDSTVLLHLVRSIYEDVPAVFLNTGLEYPEIKKFVRKEKNVIELKPKLNFLEVINKYGYPLISKEISEITYQMRNTKSDKLFDSRLYGKNGKFGLPKKWRFLIRAPFNISHICCHKLKKDPAKRYEKITNQKPFIGTMIGESNLRVTNYFRTGCNAFNNTRPVSNPLSFWTEQDIIDYIFEYNIPYCEIYDTGVTRTGCMFCCFGIHLQPEPNKFQLMKQSHPHIYKYCMETLQVKYMIEWVNKYLKKKINY